MSDPAPVRKIHHVRGARPADLYAIVTDFQAYPRLFPEVKSVRILQSGDNHWRVEFRLEMVVAIRYVLDLVGDSQAASLRWTYVEGEVVTDSRGSWNFSPDGDGTRIDYEASLSVKAPLPGFVVRRVTDALVSASLPTMFASIEREQAARQKTAPA